jgi:hypothetical protein
MGQRNAVRTDSRNPKEEIEIDFSLPALPPRIVRRQRQWLKGRSPDSGPRAGVDMLGVFTPEVTLCDARGVNDIPTAEWTVPAILAMQKNLPFFVDRQREGKWTLGQQANQIDHPPSTKIKNPAAAMHEGADAVVLIVSSDRWKRLDRARS